MLSLHRSSLALLLLLVPTFALMGCEAPSDPVEGTPEESSFVGGKADHFADDRRFEVLLTEPHCDLCERSDRDYLLENSAIISRTVELIDEATTSVDAAQFTFSRFEIEQALLRAHERGIDVRLAMNHGQRDGNNVANRLLDAGLDVRFIEGRDAGSFMGLMHAKYLIVDDEYLVTGSNNWSSTGPSINEENTIVMRSVDGDPLLEAFRCNFERVWESDADGASRCSNDEVVFTPGFGAFAALRSELRGAQKTIDVLMHHLLFENALRELTRAAERGVRVRVVINAADRDSISGNRWEQFLAAGGTVRFKQTNPDAFQIMHHKLAIIDDELLFNGSGNWSGSAFFNNFEFYIRYRQEVVLDPFMALFDRLWSWSLTEESLDLGRTAAEQAIEEALEGFSGEEAAPLFFVDGRIPTGSHHRTLADEVSLDYFVASTQPEELFNVSFSVWGDGEEDFIYTEELENVGPMSFDRLPLSLADPGDYEALMEVTTDVLTLFGDSVTIERL